MVRQLLAFVLHLAVGLSSFAAFAQHYPDRPVRIIIPNAPGGGTDTFGRVLSQKLGEIFQQTVIIENRPGAQGNIGTALGAKAAPDGYTLTLAYVSSFAVSPHVYSNIGFDPLKDFVPVALGVRQPYLLVTGPGAAFSTMRELAQAAKSRPNALTFASTSSQTELIGVVFQMMTDTRMLYVPYKTATVAVVELSRGEVDVMVASLPSAIPFVHSGKLKPIAVTGGERIVALPDVPSAREAGYPEFDVSGWYGIVAPAGTPPDIVRILNTQINRVLAMPDVQETLRAAGFEPSPISAEAFGQLIREDYARWGKVVEASKKLKQ